jgi:hypothetical protein
MVSDAADPLVALVLMKRSKISKCIIGQARGIRKFELDEDDKISGHVK